MAAYVSLNAHLIVAFKKTDPQRHFNKPKFSDFHYFNRLSQPRCAGRIIRIPRFCNTQNTPVPSMSQPGYSTATAPLYKKGSPALEANIYGS
ncbi:hypothetical protein VNI00_017010 [Paramarasmius palmivorus]|uniref:Uncharacterized protein n=1 Tax=Paramarasmius palmivorus TaxID=297713 RepID=A0AAW0B9T1_9AGAR